MSRGGRTAVALLAVVVMIGAAVLVRNALDDGGEPPPPHRATLLCAQELGDVCERVESNEDVNVVIQPAATTAERLGATTDLADIDADGWLTIAPQTGIVNDEQVRNGRAPVFGTDETIARSPLVFAGPKERLQKLTARCRASIEWVCLAGVADQPWSNVGGEEDWGQVTLGHADPKTDTVGLLAVGQEATSKLGTNDVTSTNLEDDGFDTWFRGLEQNEKRDEGDGPLASLLRFDTGIDVAQVSEAEACSRLDDAADAAKIDVVVPTPLTTADVVFAPVGRGTASDAARAAATGETARSALTKGSWRVGDDASLRKVCGAVGPVQLTRSNNVPAAGVLVALRDTLPRNG